MSLNMPILQRILYLGLHIDLKYPTLPRQMMGSMLVDDDSTVHVDILKHMLSGAPAGGFLERQMVMFVFFPRDYTRTLPEFRYMLLFCLNYHFISRNSLECGFVGKIGTFL